MKAIWQCSECLEQAEWSPQDHKEKGNPECPNCDNEMSPTGKDVVEISEDEKKFFILFKQLIHTPILTRKSSDDNTILIYIEPIELAAAISMKLDDVSKKVLYNWNSIFDVEFVGNAINEQTIAHVVHWMYKMELNHNPNRNYGIDTPAADFNLELEEEQETNSTESDCTDNAGANIKDKEHPIDTIYRKHFKK